jgi:predicted HD phosphohydrolase
MATNQVFPTDLIDRAFSKDCKQLWPEDLTWREVLKEELHNFEARISASGHATYGAADDWRQGAHDDIVLAAALAAWESRPMPKAGAVGASLY